MPRSTMSELARRGQFPARKIGRRGCSCAISYMPRYCVTVTPMLGDRVKTNARFVAQVRSTALSPARLGARPK